MCSASLGDDVKLTKIKGDAMDSRMKDDAEGTTRVVKGLMYNIEYYYDFNLKEPEYTS